MSKLFEHSLTFKPFHYQKAIDFAVEHERVHWIEEEAELAEDVADWKMRLTVEEKQFITQILRMFIQSDVNVGQFYDDLLIPVFKNKEIRAMLKSFSTREEIHKRAYALLNDTLGLPDGDYAAFLEYKEMTDKHEFMLSASNASKRGIGLALAKAVFNEGVSLFSSFVMLLNFQRRGMMKGMGKVVEWSVRDESQHAFGLAWLFRQLCQEHPRIVDDAFKREIYEMAKTAVDLEDKFIELAYGLTTIEGTTPEGIKEYVRFIADRRLTMLGMKEVWQIEENPLAWVDVILNAGDHTNFFEQKVTEYEVVSLTGEWTYSSAEYVVYGRDGCDFCLKAKELLRVLGLEYEYVDLTDHDTRQKFYADRGITEKRVPQVFQRVAEDVVRIGGYDQLVDHVQEDAPYATYLAAE